MKTSINELLSSLLFLGVVVGIPFYASFRRVKVYEAFVEGARDGAGVVLDILPYLIGMMVAIGMLRASGAIENLSHWAGPLLHHLGMPPSVLPLALMRPFSGSGTNAMLATIIQHQGANSFAAKMASVLVGSTETTFYVLAVYFGAVRIRRTRHAVAAGLIADIVGVVAAVWVAHWFFASSSVA